MRILGIDYGDKKSGVSFAEGPLSSPLKVLYHENKEEFVVQIIRTVEELEAEKVVFGMPRGTQGEKVKEVVEMVGKNINIPIEVIDEEFSTLEAQLKSREAGIRRKKRKALEDAYAATIILQNYLDSL